jgi:predicted deacylase
MKEDHPEVVRLGTAGHGRKFLFFGAIHGDEGCGPAALRRLIGAVQEGTLALIGGELIVVPVANPRAYGSGLRMTEDNLNRVFTHWEEANTYEKRLANELVPLVEECDYFLDIHSTSSPSNPCVFVDYPDNESLEFARSLGISEAILGWPELYVQASDPIQAFDTMRLAHEKGKRALIIECGQHTDSRAPDVAYAAILNALRHFGFIQGHAGKAALSAVRMRGMYIRKSARDSFARAWKHMDRFSAGEELAVSDGAHILAPFDGVILLPKESAAIGTEWFYTGEAVSGF